MTVVVTAMGLLLGKMPAIYAQMSGSDVVSPLPSQVVNSLVYPTNSQQFFEAGQQKFEKEIKQLLLQPEVSDEELLRIDKNLDTQKSYLELKEQFKIKHN